MLSASRPSRFASREAAIQAAGASRIGTALARAWLPAAMAAIWIGALAWFWDAGLNHDTSWYVTAVRRWLFDGGRLYVDIVELNPPLAFHLTAPPVLAARGFGIADPLAFNLYLLLLAAISSALLLRIVSGADKASASLAGAYTISALIVALFASMPEQGQREHFTVIFALPFVTLAAFSPLGARATVPMRVSLAAWACLGLFLKPHFLLVPAAISLLACWRARSWRPLFSIENCTIGILAILYVSAIALLYPAYFTDIIPLARSTYGSFHLTALVIVPFQIALAVLLAAFILLIKKRQQAPSRQAAEMLFATALSFLAAYVMQNKGFGYQRVPAEAFFALTAIAFTVGALEAKGVAWRIAVGSAAAVALIALYFLSWGRYDTDIAREMRREFGAELAGRKVAGFSVFLQPFFPFVNDAKAEWTLRYPSLWPLRSAAADMASGDTGSSEKAKAIVDRVARDVADDLEKGAPDYVIVERRFQPRLDYVQLLSAEPRFAAAWSHYRMVRSIDSIELWERIGVSYASLEGRRPAVLTRGTRVTHRTPE